MKTFTVEGLNWREDFKVDDSLFDSYEDMALEAMTLAVEEILRLPEERETWTGGLHRWGGSHERGHEDELMFGWTTMAWEKGQRGNPDKRIAAFTEYVLRNSGEHKWADTVHKSWEKERLA